MVTLTYCWQEEVVDHKYDKTYEIIRENVATDIGEWKTSKTRKHLCVCISEMSIYYG